VAPIVITPEHLMLFGILMGRLASKTWEKVSQMSVEEAMSKKAELEKETDELLEQL